jgi:hypothetical protein
MFIKRKEKKKDSPDIQIRGETPLIIPQKKIVVTIGLDYYTQELEIKLLTTYLKGRRFLLLELFFYKQIYL